MGRVEAICVSRSKGERKRPVQRAILREGHGIEGDGHAGPWHRQVSILSAADVATVKNKLPDVAYGDFAENLILSGVDLSSLGLGSRIRLGSDAVVSITQIGKVCHSPCRIYALTGDCIMPRLGLFARVETGGALEPGDEAALIEVVGREVFQAVVLTVSDTCSRDAAQDTAGPATSELLERAMRCHVYRREIIPDELETIKERLEHYSSGHSIDLVVTVGGTGFSPRDVTPEATSALIERPAPGLAEAMRAASLAKTPYAMLSRAVCGIVGETLIVNLPGSRKAALENLGAMLPALPHGLKKLRGDATKCATDDETGKPDA